LKQSKAAKNISESGLVSSSQSGVHPRLEACVLRHLQANWAQPFHRPTLETYLQLEQLGVFTPGRPVVLDSGCGTGDSTCRLASLFPSHLVIGVDRSLKRLAKSGVTSGILRAGNFVLARAELATFWRLLLNSGISPERHFLFYPNPWPKPGHLTRRWHGHPVFPQLLALGGEIEMRCNWEIYAQEFAQAAGFATAADIKAMKINPDEGISPFETKYLERGQSLFSVTVPARHTDAFRGSWAGTPTTVLPA
jgi:tRNA (guanine-N7-)-methyltransferase